MLKILVAEDDIHLRKLIVTYLLKNGYQIAEASHGEEAFQYFLNHHVDVLITDVMMPIMDGNTLVKKIRSMNRDLPIMMLTALERYADKEKGFLSGVDDYMVKPVDMQEMLLRIKALARRYQLVVANKIELPTLLLDANSGTCLLNQTSVSLTSKEFRLLFKLLSTPNKIFTREQLMNEIWGFDSESYDRTVDTHIKRIRDLVSCDDYEIITVRRLGYKAVLK
ncbi:MAG TPA: DNA-binding response regulator [Firmicutes bacterium]|jgi:DNA-binding response OmpR family regulator|nr:DNA-binding response regulator [Bacillota bacterium]